MNAHASRKRVGANVVGKSHWRRPPVSVVQAQNHVDKTHATMEHVLASQGVLRAGTGLADRKTTRDVPPGRTRS
jgi:hypothetical protein